MGISVIILTFNEELHIERCIRNVQLFSKEIFIVDSFSSDQTVLIAKKLGVKVFQHKWENNYAKQFNWGLDNLPINTEWVLRLDADEYLTKELIAEIQTKLPNLEESISGIVLNRKQNCFGSWVNPLELIRIFKYGNGQCEERWMDEHIVLNSGKTIHFDHFFLDDNMNTFSWWINKHNGYSIREAIDLLDLEFNLAGTVKILDGIGEEASEKRMKKLKYAKAPLFWRSFFYFLYRYFFKLGFLKGKEQFIWDFFQGLWYRTLVDAKIYEIKKHCGTDTDKMKVFIKENYQIEI